MTIHLESLRLVSAARAVSSTVSPSSSSSVRLTAARVELLLAVPLMAASVASSNCAISSRRICGSASNAANTALARTSIASTSQRLLLLRVRLLAGPLREPRASGCTNAFLSAFALPPARSAVCRALLLAHCALCPLSLSLSLRRLRARAVAVSGPGACDSSAHRRSKKISTAIADRRGRTDPLSARSVSRAREIAIPSPGVVHRQVTAYANGVYLGHHVGYLHELEWDVTAAVAAAAAGGRSSLAVVLAVDSFHDMTIDPLIGAFDMGEIPSLNARLSSGGAALEGLSGPWGGIWGHVALEWRRRTWLAEMFAQATNATVVATAALHGAPTAGSGDHVQLEVFDCSTGQMVATSTAQLAHALDPATQQLSVRAVIPEADLQRWSPSAPALYNATLTLLSSSAPGSLPAATDSLTVRFGVKDLRIVGHQFVLNGRKIFLSGFGMDSSFADTIAAPSDKAYYLRRWQLAKSFGFNFVRCHSGFYPPELYAAADEVGMFVSPELPIIGDTYYNAALRLNSTFAYHGAWRAVITRFRNHPS